MERHSPRVSPLPRRPSVTTPGRPWLMLPHAANLPPAQVPFSGWEGPPGSLGSGFPSAPPCWPPPEWPAAQPGVVGRTMAPKDKSTLVPQACMYVTSHGQRNFADGMELRTVGEEGVLDSQALSRKCDDRSRSGRCWASGFEEGGAKSRGKLALQELAEARKRILPPGGNQPCPHLDFSPGRPVCDFNTHALSQPAR